MAADRAPRIGLSSNSWATTVLRSPDVVPTKGRLGADLRVAKALLDELA